MNILLYYFKESFIGLFRNKSATIASIILIIISLTFSSLLFLLNSNIGDTIHFLESQTKIKVFLKEGTDVKSYEKKLINIHSISSIEYVSSEETLKSMKNMLKDKKHLFTLFSKNDIPDSYLIDVKNRADTTKTIEEIRNIKGTSDTFYPQEFAQKLISFTK
jgi:cell division transport system permease protein